MELKPVKTDPKKFYEIFGLKMSATIAKTISNQLTDIV